MNLYAAAFISCVTVPIIWHTDLVTDMSKNVFMVQAIKLLSRTIVCGLCSITFDLKKKLYKN